MLNDSKLKLKELLCKFVDKNLIQDSVVELTHQYLFEGSFVPIFVNTELFQVVIYLKDIVDKGQFKSIDDILNFYDMKKKKMREFVRDLMTKKRL